MIYVNLFFCGGIMDVRNISQAVITRLPRYYRFLGELKDKGIERISSQELADIMNATASQIRQDFNNFGGFGQQGYGYNVELLYKEIGKILGLDKHYNLVIIGAGNIGQALAWLEDSDMQALTRCAAQITGALAQKDAYSVLRLLAGYEKDRQSALTLLELLDLQLRDALAMQYGQNDSAGCDRRSAEGLSRGLSVSRAARMHEAIRDAWEALDANVSTRIVLAALGGELVS